MRMASLLPEEQEPYLDDRADRRARAPHPRPALVKKFEEARLQGSIRKLKQDRGFGFVAGDDGCDYFFHWSGMEKSSKNFRELEIQDRVSFIVVDGEKGPRAVCIRVL